MTNNKVKNKEKGTVSKLKIKLKRSINQKKIIKEKEKYWHSLIAVFYFKCLVRK